MPPRKSAKAAEPKKAKESKATVIKKATTKASSKLKVAPKTKKVATKKVEGEEEEQVAVVETKPEPEPQPVEGTEPEKEKEEEEEAVVVEHADTENETKEGPEVAVEEAPQEEQVSAVDTAEDPEKTAESVDEDKINAHRIFVTRIAFEATKDDLEEYFAKFGIVRDAYCPRQQGNTSLNKGFGFISFDNEKAIQKVFDSRPHFIMGREVIVDRATGQKYHTSDGTRKRNDTQNSRSRNNYREGPRNKRHNEGYGDRTPDKYYRRDREDRSRTYSANDRGNYSGSVPPYRQGGNGGFDPNKPVSFVFSGSARSENNDDYDNRYGSRGSSGRQHTAPSSRGRATPKLFIGRISFDTTVQSLRAYFSQFGEVVDAYIPKDSHTQRSKGFGFLTFAHKHSIHAVLEPNAKHTLDGRELIVDYADVSHRRN